MLFFQPSISEKSLLFAVGIIGAMLTPAVAQVATVQVPAAAPQSDRLDNGTLVQRGVTLGVGGAAATYGVGKVSGAAKGLVNVGKVRNVAHWGPATASVPIFGKAAAGGHIIPTTIGQVPVMGYVVNRVPVVGPVIAGPANPILVGAVAIDNYVIPKYSPCGYTKSSIVAVTNDFNSPPKLRGYVNYLAPLPYTHPPIYSPATLNTDLPADVAYIDGVAPHTLVSGMTLPGSATPYQTDSSRSDYAGAGTGGGLGPAASTNPTGGLYSVNTTP